MTAGDYVKLLRPEQFYKNLVIFLAAYFSGNLLMLSNAAGFILLCALSSANYIINDVVDRKKDKINLEKADRPLASGKISVIQAIILALLLLAISLGGAYAINYHFFLIAASSFLLGSLYSLVLRKELFLDIIAISFNYVLRAIAGAVLIGVWISPWLVVGAFFLALFLATGKRRSEKTYLEANANKHRPLLELYSGDMLNFLLQMSATMLLASYALYSFLGNKPQLVFTLPIVLYAILRYVHLLESTAPETRALNKAFTDARFMAAGAFYLATSLYILYR